MECRPALSQLARSKAGHVPERRESWSVFPSGACLWQSTPRKTKRAGGRTICGENGEKGGWEESGDGLVSVDRSCLTSARWWRQDGAGEESGCCRLHCASTTLFVPPRCRPARALATVRLVLYTLRSWASARHCARDTSPVCRRHETTLATCPPRPAPFGL